VTKKPKVQFKGIKRAVEISKPIDPTDILSTAKPVEKTIGKPLVEEKLVVQEELKPRKLTKKPVETISKPLVDEKVEEQLKTRKLTKKPTEITSKPLVKETVVKVEEKPTAAMPIDKAPVKLDTKLTDEDIASAFQSLKVKNTTDDKFLNTFEDAFSIAKQYTSDTTPLKNILEYIFKTHYTCYMLCVKETDPKLYKLESKTGDPILDQQIKKTLKKRKLENKTKTRTWRRMGCIIKPFKTESTFAKEWLPFIQSVKTTLPNGVFILSLSDSMLLPESLQAAYLPAYAYSGKIDYKDIPIPNYDDLFDNKIGEVQTDWSKKKNIAVFRGGSTGCGGTAENNQRLKLATMRSADLDVGITQYTTHLKFISPEEIEVAEEVAPTVPKLTWEQQSGFKYLIHVDGNVFAYRYLKSMLTKSVILRVKSDYTHWTDKYMKPNEHYIEVKADLSDLKEKVKWCKENDESCKKIAENGYNFAVNVLKDEVLRRAFVNILSGKDALEAAEAEPQLQDQEESALVKKIKADINAKHQGLPNCGLTCYVNSVLQMLSYVPEFVQELSINETKEGKNVYEIFKMLYGENQITAKNIRPNMYAIQSLVQFPKKTQQDVSEFLQLLFDNLELITPYFYYNISIETICKNNPELKPKADPIVTPDRILRVIVPDENKPTSISSLLQNELKEEELEDTNVERCRDNKVKGTGAAISKMSYKIPEDNKYLMIQLKIFNNELEKIDESILKNIEFDDVLQIDNKRYKLYGVISHEGEDISSGHYIFTKKTQTNNGLIYNDDKVTPITDFNTNEVVRNGYMFIYKIDEGEPTTIEEGDEPKEKMTDFFAMKYDEVKKIFNDMKRELQKKMDIKYISHTLYSEGKPVVIIPYRDNPKQDRKKHLETITKFFKDTVPNIKVCIIEQSDDGQKFNRGKLLNVGYNLLKDKYDTFIFHDVDMIPSKSLLQFYKVKPKCVLHLAAPLMQEKYAYAGFMGGVLSISSEDFSQINGFPNNFWGWGGEDEDLKFRMLLSDKCIVRPESKKYDKYKELKHALTQEDKTSVITQEKELVLDDIVNNKWKKNGLNDLKYDILKQSSINGADVYSVDILPKVEKEPEAAVEEEVIIEDANVKALLEEEPPAEYTTTKGKIKKIAIPVEEQIEELPPRRLKTSKKKYKGALETLAASIQQSIQKDPYKEKDPQPYTGQDRKSFSTAFIPVRFSDFTLPALIKDKFDENACSKLKLETYNYQAFVREYIRQTSPYRGVLVYHGLGSGKTCTSIAAAEALYGQSGKKIIVLTPASLRENFFDQLMFCGFNHYRLNNYWISFPLSHAHVRMFAENVLEIPSDYINSILRSKDVENHVIWVPDLSKPESESNFNKLQDWERTSIRNQLRAYLNDKFNFIGYTGYSISRLLKIAVKNPTFFDDAVIVIDEIHNLSRLMSGKLDSFLDKQSKHYENLTTEKWRPKWIGVGQEQLPEDDKWTPDFVKRSYKYYSRAFLFYVLLLQAKNSKIIALSGTPIVNHPIEFGILSNILHGYFNCVEFNIKTPTDPKDQPKHDETVKEIKEKILAVHPRVNFFDSEKTKENTKFFITMLEDGYVKSIKKEPLEGTGQFKDSTVITYVGEDATPATIQELFTDISSKLGVKIKGEPVYRMESLFPPVMKDFNEYFIDEKSATVKNTDSFTRRTSGLVSYYRGSKEELMPKVTKDEIIFCKFSPYNQSEYEKIRKEEINKESKTTKPVAAEALELSTKNKSDSYRLNSRAICNFCFPVDIPRPYPKNMRDVKEMVSMDKADITEKAEISNPEVENEEKTVLEEDEYLSKGQENDEEEQEQLQEEKQEAKGKESDFKMLQMEAFNKLSSIKEEIFHIEDNVPEEKQLKHYSHKFLEIFKRIQQSPGSSLLYSVFKVLEGLGVFSLVLEANGFQRIRLTGSEKDLELDAETVKSFRERPEQPRFIMYSGSESFTERMTLINVFNSDLKKLPPKIKPILEEFNAAYLSKFPEMKSKYEKPKEKVEETVEEKQKEIKGPIQNMYGELCKVFMITKAGAEGLSLYNVRTVHIMEPYWNKVLTDQVKGRAVRICSHKNLPVSERTVDVFTYLSIFNGPPSLTFQLKDNSKTSDEYIFQLATEKDKISNAFLSKIKNGAVDCTLNKSENEKGIQCVAYSDSDDFLYDPRINKDVTVQIKTEQVVDAAAEPETKVEGKEYVKDGITYLIIKDAIYKKPYIQGISKQVGEVIEKEVEGKMKKALKFYKK
jgi:ubiquitin C-terminal hydrolase